MPSIFSVSTFVVAFALAAEAGGVPIVTATTIDGQLLSGVVDARTDDHSLWLRRDTARASLAISSTWRNIETAHIDGKPIAKQELRRLASNLATSRSVSDVWAATSQQGSATGDLVPHPAAGRPALPRIAALRVTAVVANWDADAEPDGLEVAVTPVDSRGVPTPVRGELTLRLFGSRRASRHTKRFEQLTQWATPVEASDFQHGAAVYQMPFGGVVHEEQTDIGSLARIEARLGVFGTGAFVATAPVRLRAFDPLGDELQLSTGRRVFSAQRSTAQPAATATGDGLFFSAPVGP